VRARAFTRRRSRLGSARLFTTTRTLNAPLNDIFWRLFRYHRFARRGTRYIHRRVRSIASLELRSRARARACFVKIPITRINERSPQGKPVDRTIFLYRAPIVNELSSREEAPAIECESSFVGFTIYIAARTEYNHVLRRKLEATNQQLTVHDKRSNYDRHNVTFNLFLLPLFLLSSAPEILNRRFCVETERANETPCKRILNIVQS